jgi:hypothetical protein
MALPDSERRRRLRAARLIPRDFMQIQKTNDRRTAPKCSSLKGLRVLFLPKNSRTAYFRSILEDARERLDWDVSVVCPYAFQDVWRGAVKNDRSYFPMPDFGDHQSWETDSDKVAEIDDFIGWCERATGISAGRVLLAGERYLGRGFSLPNYYWFHDRIAKRVLADNTEPSRIVRRMFAFARDTLRDARPDVVMSGEWADPICFCFLLAARTMQIRTVVNRPSKIWSGRCYWSDDLLAFNRLSKESAGRRGERNAAVSTRAIDRIADFRSTPATLGYVKQNWESDARKSWLAGHADLARFFWAQLRYQLQGRNGPRPKPALQLTLEHYRRPFLKWRQKGLFAQFDEQELGDTRFIYFAMHKDPEQALNFQGSIWSNQYNTIALLCGVLPTGYKFLVREHRRNAGRRRTRFYNELSRLPGVVLVDSFDDQFKYIKNADLVVTDNGSTGWEGLLLNRRVITLADTFYDGCALSVRFNDTARLAELVVDFLAKPEAGNSAAHDAALGRLLDAEWEMSMPLDDTGHDATFDTLARVLSLTSEQRVRKSKPA